MDRTAADTELIVRFSRSQIAAIDAWISRADAPAPSREEAVRMIVAGQLGPHGASTILPGLVTGRDIV